MENRKIVKSWTWILPILCVCLMLVVGGCEPSQSDRRSNPKAYEHTSLIAIIAKPIVIFMRIMMAYVLQYGVC